jgi:hypothetical protein
LKNVYYIPTATKGILSLGTLHEDAWKISCDDSVLQREQDGIKMRSSGDLYYVEAGDWKEKPMIGSTALGIQARDLTPLGKLHIRMGYIGRSTCPTSVDSEIHLKINELAPISENYFSIRWSQRPSSSLQFGFSETMCHLPWL